ncbi:MAG: family 78 glycoside hydrolase catalytic domain [Candidatus Sumerlaeaceae bacterium]
MMNGMPARSAPAEASQIRVNNLRCEYLTQPLGIDTTAPRLSWIVSSPGRGEVQSAWQVRVASSREGLEPGPGDLWDSGKVDGAETNQIVYAGKPLVSGQRCWWKVRSWDREGLPTPWSEPAWWEMALLDSTDWKAKWIGTDRKIVPVIGLEGASWIAPADNAPTTEPITYRKTFAMPAGRNVLTARIRFACDQPVHVFCNGKQLGTTSGDWRSLDVFEPGHTLRVGENIIAARLDPGETSVPLIGRIEVISDYGGPIRHNSDKTWSVQRGPVQDEDLSTSTESNGWSPAREICKWGEGDKVPATTPDARVNAHPAPLLRRSFDLKSAPRAARLRVCGMGYHDVYLNGQRVGDHVLDPAYTDYRKRLLYVTHDVTSLLNQGRNAVGVMLGTGWYDVHTLAEWNFDSAWWRATPRVIVQLEIDMEDSSRVVIGSNKQWRVGEGPVVFDSIYEGETYDARSEVQGWSTAEFNDKPWKPATEVDAPRGNLRAQQVQPIRATKTLDAVRVTEPRPGVYLFDFGQNMSGVPVLSIEGPAGTSITMTCGERLKPDGSLELHPIDGFTRKRDMRQRFQADVYILKGGARETWQPRFTYHGFQYVEITGAPFPLVAANLRAKVLHTDVPAVGDFTCSNDLFNRIQHNTLWSYLSNLMGIPTDCPHREKNGWTGDAHLAWHTGNYNFDGAAFYTKWVNDLADAQRPDGDLPGIVPSNGWGYDPWIGPAWDMAYLLIPWYMYEFYGDTRILEEHYDNMKRYVELLRTRTKDGIVTYGLGDWCPAETTTSKTLTSTACLYRDAQILSDTAALLGRTDDVSRYAALADETRTAFNREFLDPTTGLYDNGSQTAQACALYEDLAPPDHRDQILDNLIKAIERSNNHIDTGILGAKYLPNVLMQAGRTDVTYAMFNQRTRPSYGWWIDQGATTLWEQWNGDDSRNHIMFGEIGAWFYKALAGIRCAAPGWKKIEIRPQVPDDMTSAAGHYDSIAGRIASAWTLDNDTFELRVEIPANTSATVAIPTADANQVREADGPASSAEGVHLLRIETSNSHDPRVLFEVGSGSYLFRAPMARTKRAK